ncbi:MULTISPECIES: selenium cofactor biosynthesis protein YqeC [Caldilinea]|uniref:selenium cofactor biosynthesis protein YqeC n=1 Tax=Caldilinea TaxID=233191 RepID=UPI0006949213|nr:MULTISPECIES: selenium cofactor biosynthesis protein YqeC [Caldilinea]
MLLHQALRLSASSSGQNTVDVVAFVGGGGKSSAAFRLAAEVAAAGRRAIVAPTTRIAAFQTDWAPAFVEVSGSEIPWDILEQALTRHGYCLLGGPVVGDRRLGLEATQVDLLAQRAVSLGVAVITVEADGSKMRPVKAPADHEPVLPDATTHLVPVMGMDAIGAALDERKVHRPERVRAALSLPAGATPLLTPSMAAHLLCSPAGGAKGLRPSMRFVPLLNKADTPLRLAYARVVATLLAAQGVSALTTRVGDPVHEPVAERWGQVAVVVLAAGGSVRMQRPKPLIEVEGAPMIVRSVRTALQAAIGPVWVVTGAEAEAVRTALSAWLGDITHVHNPNWQGGQATSVVTTLHNLPAAIEAVLFMPVDQPFLDPLLLRRLYAAWRAGADLAAPQVEGDLRGAPALFDRRFWNELLTLQGDVGGRRVLASHRDEVAAVPAEARWLIDVDTPEDLQELTRRPFVDEA